MIIFKVGSGEWWWGWYVEVEFLVDWRGEEVGSEVVDGGVGCGCMDSCF